MTDANMNEHTKLINLTPEEKRLYGQLFKQADTKGDNIVTGEIAVKLFNRTRLSEHTLGEIWAMADTENRGFLLQDDFAKALRLVAHYQALPGRTLTQELALEPAPPGFPQFDGINLPPGTKFSEPSSFKPASSIQAQTSGPIRVPPLTPDKVTHYTRLFEQAGAQNGILPGEVARSFFERWELPTDVLAHVWNLADTEQRSALSLTEFIIAMHLLSSYKSRVLPILPQALPQGLFEAASRRPATVPNRQVGIGRPEASSLPRQFSGSNARNSSPLARPPYTAPPANDWLIGPPEKASFDELFDKVDTQHLGFITGQQAVEFFSQSELPSEVLASIWDLSNIRQLDQLNRDEFAVAMYLIRDQRGKAKPDLPTKLPPNLYPPSLRHLVQQGPPLPGAPPQAPVPKSATEDLFGLDALQSSPTAPVKQQTTGGSGSFARAFDADPFANKTSSPTSPGFPAPRGPQSHFKPFVPTSSFGQNLTSQSTGASATSSTVQSRDLKPSAMDDLLGDTDPEVSKKLTAETTEVANLSNQFGTLRTQMQEIQNKKVATETDLKSTSTQKRDLELRLAQFRSQYEQELKSYKALDEQLNSLRGETFRLQRELAMLEASYQDLQAQHRQTSQSLETDRRENSSLKERMRQINAEIQQLRPQLDKMRMDSRHEKGLVSINKKQLEKSEDERNKIKKEMETYSKTTQDVRSSSTDSRVSPAPSSTSQSTNPFFRRSPQPTFDNSMTPSGFAAATQPPQKEPAQFDNIFGPSFTPPSTSPSTTFRPDAFNSLAGSKPAESETTEHDVPTPSTSPHLSQQDSPRVEALPPATRQMSSRDLPIREPFRGNEPSSTGTRGETPTSRFGPSGNETPTNAGSSSPRQRGLERTESKNETSTGAAMFDRPSNTSPVASTTSAGSRGPAAKQVDHNDFFRTISHPREAPGAFPDTPPVRQDVTGESGFSERSKGSGRPSESGFGSSRADPFAFPGPPSNRPTAATTADFDAVFAGVGNQKQGARRGAASSPVSNQLDSEFPPIQVREEDSDTNSEHGFEDDFTQVSPQHQRKKSQNQKQQQRAAGGENTAAGRPTTAQTSSTAADFAPPPSVNAQKSPPGYESATAGNKDASHFPLEFGGLLPSRENPLPASASQSPERTFAQPAAPVGHGASLFGSSGPSNAKSAAPAPQSNVFAAASPVTGTPASTVQSDAYHSAVSHPSTDKASPSSIHQTLSQGQNTKASSSTAAASGAGQSTYSDDFDHGFDDLAEAKEDDDRADDDFMFDSAAHEGFDEFNPAFDSPAASKSNTMASERVGPAGHSNAKGFSPDDAFGEFDFGGKSAASAQKAAQNDWDAMLKGFSGGGPAIGGVVVPGSSQQGADLSNAFGNSSGKGAEKAFGGESSDSLFPEAPEPPKLGRALSEGTEHDDPILKRLTTMGYPRPAALGALEKYDYDFEKVG
ncbi:hypothetical protein EJ06DRAFT_166024 [Trichodelitschia bisporula]|uniref:EF-hand n=1 Tax=Trichodelitschia bisporula TaxID=703511 RepID=A0A6G1HMR9_9PEZI|nr:hypothetical protein EJ06DRAFT_166024 [Trichodelitschia bisporula]